MFKLTNCYLCDNIRTPLVCATHLINQGFEIHLTQQGHNMVFPDKSISTLTTQSNGLIALLPVPLSMLTKKKSLSSLSTQASVAPWVQQSTNDFPMNQVERIGEIKTDHNRYDKVPDLVSDGSSSDISTDSEDSDDNDED